MSKNGHQLSTCKLYTLNVVYTVHIVYLHSLDLSAASQQQVFISLDWGYKRFDVFLSSCAPSTFWPAAVCSCVQIGFTATMATVKCSKSNPNCSHQNHGCLSLTPFTKGSYLRHTFIARLQGREGSSERAMVHVAPYILCVVWFSPPRLCKVLQASHFHYPSLCGS